MIFPYFCIITEHAKRQFRQYQHRPISCEFPDKAFLFHELLTVARNGPNIVLFNARNLEFTRFFSGPWPGGKGKLLI